MPKTRCSWAESNLLLKEYHDKEWGIPVHDDHKHFEMLILEGAQAGLNWTTILKKRQAYFNAFKQFDPNEVAVMTDKALAHLLENPGLVRNRLKIWSARKNAKVFLEIQKEFTSFNTYVWKFVNNTPMINNRKPSQATATDCSESRALSKDLKKRGMSFVGNSIIYAYMQAVGMINDHAIDCCCFKVKN